MFDDDDDDDDVAWWRNEQSVGHANAMSQIRLTVAHCCITTLGTLFTPLCLYHQTVEFGTGIKRRK